MKFIFRNDVDLFVEKLDFVFGDLRFLVEWKIKLLVKYLKGDKFVKMVERGIYLE